MFPSRAAWPWPQALSRSGWTMIMPMTAPRYWLAPNTLAALKPISTGRNTNAALAKRLIIAARSAIAGHWPIRFSSSASQGHRPGWASRLNRPIIRPEATSAGISGTKMSESVLTARWAGFMCAAAAFLTSSMLASWMWVSAAISSCTLLTVPGPRMIWYWPPAVNDPATASIFSTAFLSALVSSTSTSLRRVAQWA